MSSKRRQRHHECSRKTRYDTRKEAEDVQRFKRTLGVRLSVYKCNWCGGFHVGHGKPQTAGRGHQWGRDKRQEASK